MLERLHPARLTPMILASPACRSHPAGTRCMSRRLLGYHRTKRLDDGNFTRGTERQKCLMAVSSLLQRQGENDTGSSWVEFSGGYGAGRRNKSGILNFADHGAFSSFSQPRSVTRESGNLEIENCSHLLVLQRIPSIYGETQAGTCFSFAFLHFRKQLTACPELFHAVRLGRPSVSG